MNFKLMTWKQGLFAIGYFVLVLRMAAGPLDDKSPGYFVNRYGEAKASKSLSQHALIHPERGAVTVKGQFSAREFRDGELWVQALFFLPSLKPAVVRLQLNHSWTVEQIQAALAAYGGQWKPVRKGVLNCWMAPDGSMAISMLTWIDIQSKAMVDLAERTLAEEDAKRKAIPKL